MTDHEKNLRHALTSLTAIRWDGCRDNHRKDSVTACEHFIRTCAELGLGEDGLPTQGHLDTYALGLKNRGLSASTINTRLVAVKAFCEHIGLAGLSYNYSTRKAHTKWHMTDQQLGMVPGILGTLIEQGRVGQEEAKLVATYIHWTIETGLRVEETLRLLWADFEGIGILPGAVPRPALNVPGTKNEQSAVRIPISDEAATCIQARYTVIAAGAYGGGHKRLFDISYQRLRAIWEMLRAALGLQENPTATLKALRRNFAAGALRKGLSARIIQELMRHKNIETTMGYLRLIGMSDNDETRALLNRQLVQATPPANAKVPGFMPPSSTLDLFDTSALEAELLRRKGTSDGQV